MLKHDSYGNQGKSLNSQSLDEKIQFSERIINWQNQFKYSDLNIHDLQGVFVDNNPVFQGLKDLIRKYNEQLFQQKGKKIINGPIKQNFFQNLMNLMRQIMVTTDRNQQKLFINKVSVWAQATFSTLISPNQNSNRYQSKSLYKKTDISQKITDQSDQMQTTINDSLLRTINKSDQDDFDSSKIVKINTLFSISPDRQNLNDTLNDTMQDYNCGARTIHSDINPPQMRLKDYQSRKINFTLIPKQTGKVPFARSIKRVFPSEYNVEKLNVMPYKSQLNIEGNDQTLIEDDDVIASEIMKMRETNEEEEKEERGTVSLAPLMKVFITDDATDPEPPKKLITSTYTFYQPTSDIREVKLENRWLKNRSKFLSEKRENQEMLTHMNSWAKYRGRIEKEIDRKIDTKQNGNKYLNCSYQDPQPQDKIPFESIVPQTPAYYTSLLQLEKKRPQSITLSSNFPFVPPAPTDEDIETKVNQSRVKSLKTNYNNILKLQNNHGEVTYVPEGLSVYDRVTIKRKQTFQNIVRRNTDTYDLDQLEEIQQIKNRMAKYRLNVPTKRLMTGLVTPCWDSIKMDDLPPPGYGLLENPFEEKKTKKKKTKKQ